MKVVYSAGHLSHRARRVLTIGTFDGVHVGHQKILKTLVRTARRLKAKSVILTFRDHPQKVLRPQRPMPLLISLNGMAKSLYLQLEEGQFVAWVGNIGIDTSQHVSQVA